MKKILKFLFLLVLPVNSTILLTSCTIKFGNPKSDQFNSVPETEQYNTETLLTQTKKKLETTWIDGSTLDLNASVGHYSNKNKIITLIRNIINNKDIKVEIHHSSLYKTLLQTDNKVTIEISCNGFVKHLDVRFKDLKSNNNQSKNKQYNEEALLEQTKKKLETIWIDGSTLDLNVSVGYYSNENKIITLIGKIISDKGIKVEIHHSSWNKKLSETNNKVNIKISCNGFVKCLDVRFKNLKSTNNQSKNEQYNTEVLLEQTRVKLESTLIEGSTLDPDALIGSGSNKDKIISLIENVINNKDIKVEIYPSSWNKKLSETNNKVNIKISCNESTKRFDVKFKNVKSTTEVLFEQTRVKLESTLIEGSTLDPDALIGSGSNKDKIIRLIENVINNKDIKVEIYHSSWNKKLSETNNKVNIKISCNESTKRFDVKFKNVKSTTEVLLEQTRVKLESTLIEGSTLDPDALIGSGSNKDKIISLIENVINNKDIKVDIHHSSWNKKLSETDNKVNIKISCNRLTKHFDVKFKIMTKKFASPLEEIANASFYDLIGIDSNSQNDKSKVKKAYRLFQLCIHEDKIASFFENWYEKVKNNVSCKKFDEIYTALSFKILKILKDEVREVEAVLKKINNWYQKIIDENKVINKFKQLLLETNKHINGKKTSEESKWR